MTKPFAVFVDVVSAAPGTLRAQHSLRANPTMGYPSDSDVGNGRRAAGTYVPRPSMSEPVSPRDAPGRARSQEMIQVPGPLRGWKLTSCSGRSGRLVRQPCMLACCLNRRVRCLRLPSSRAAEHSGLCSPLSRDRLQCRSPQVRATGWQGPASMAATGEQPLSMGHEQYSTTSSSRHTRSSLRPVSQLKVHAAWMCL